MFTLPQNIPEEGTGSCQDDLVSLNLLVTLTGQSNITKVFLKFSEGTTNILLEVIPLKTELL